MNKSTNQSAVKHMRLNLKLKRMKEMIVIWKSLWSLNKISSSLEMEMYREQFWEYAYWC